jgi:Ca2+:H+ antiporter
VRSDAAPPRLRLHPSLDWLLVLVPVSLVARFALDQDLLTFVTAALAIIPLAGLIGRGTEQLALHAGPRVGGLLNATFGNVTELIIAVFLILRGELGVVKASLTGSILGNLLLVLGLSFLVGGLRHTEQRYNAQAAGVHASSLALAVIGLFMPALFVQTSGQADFAQREVVSGVVAGVLILLYVAALVFTMVTHEHLFRTPQPEERPEWTMSRALTLLLAATALVALESELLVGSLEPALESLGLSKFFVGLIVIPIIGNAAEHSSAVMFAVKDQLDVTLEIAIGSSTQVALFVAPVLVFVSLAVGHPMDFVFTTFEIAAVALATLIVALISLDGRSNWLEGAQLVGAYTIMAISFFFVPSA